MVSLTILLGAAAALACSTASALNLPQRRGGTGWTVIDNNPFSQQEYCRVSQQSARGWSHAGPLNMSIYEFPCPFVKGYQDCTLIERIATNIRQNDTIDWVVDIPVNITYMLVYEQNGTLTQFMTTVPPTDNTDCDQSLLKLPFSAASLSNATGLIGKPEVGSATIASYGYWGALALMAAGVAVIL